MTESSRDEPKKGNSKIGVEGSIFAKEKAAKNDARLEAAKLEIEAGIRDGSILKVTAKYVLRRAGLRPHFLSKPARRDTNEALKLWLVKQNGLVGRAARRAASVSDDKKALAALRDDFVRLQNAYALDALTGVAMGKALKAEMIKAARLADENAALRARLSSAGLPDHA